MKRSKSGLAAAIVGLSRPQKRAIILGVDMALAVLAYFVARPIFDMSGADAVFSIEGGLPLLLTVMVVGATSTILQIPSTQLKAYDAKNFGWIGGLAVITALVSWALHEIGTYSPPAGFFFVFGITFFVLSTSSRLVLLEMLFAIYRMRGTRSRVIIYGAGTTGIQLARALGAHERVEPVAFVDDNPALQRLTIAGLPVLRPADIETVVQDRKVKRVLLAMPSLSRAKLSQIARRLETLGLTVQVLPSFSQLVGEEPLVAKLKTLSPAKLMGRQTFDRRAEGVRNLRDKSVLVSGGGGSIGSELCRQVLGCRARRLVIFELSELALYETERALRPLADEAGVELVPVLGSVTEARLVRHVLQTYAIQVVFHAAAYKHVPIVECNPLVGLANNVLGTWTLARESHAAGAERFVLISSDKAVRPTNVMGASKRLAELVVQDLAARSTGTIFSMVRFGNVIGSSGSVIPLFKEQIAQGGPVTVTHRDVTRYFMSVEEAVSLVLVAGSFAAGGEVFVLDMGKPLRIWDIAARLILESDSTVKTADNPDGDIEIVETGLRPGEKLHEELMIGQAHISTQHEKIFCAREARLSEIEVASAIRALREALATGDEAAASAVASRWVEGYAAHRTGTRPAPAPVVAPAEAVMAEATDDDTGPLVVAPTPA
ncbi:NAD-dependent epimerase/dehydratase family protein [Palleronia sediminis]|uniref:NAD-dependent epimerase/dehydratase family protein n=1 Tax=Palleronia sediminis TaxID=2547833 RepID=A0A4R6AJA9_9RHOB|nr:nucleoside-diphosphate sugar epimerase/dehydratase [Palleronia sediminis]TDL81806.1 NAD-dependent epimerase/dehydratase family protein [Palleronia sediminis]